MLYLTTPDFTPISSSHGLEKLCPSDQRKPFLRLIFQEFGAVKNQRQTSIT